MTASLSPEKEKRRFRNLAVRSGVNLGVINEERTVGEGSERRRLLRPPGRPPGGCLEWCCGPPIEVFTDGLTERLGRRCLGQPLDRGFGFSPLGHTQPLLDLLAL
uniref:Uncharacterized protein n=1 Tax=Knipowitschia caucasica TaxID=637954 RepID=A0AAV2LJS6_KNICA